MGIALPADSRPRSVSLALRFALASGLVLLAAAGVLGKFGSDRAVGQLTAMSEHNNATLTRAFANVIWPGYREFVRTARDIEPEALRTHPMSAQLGAALRQLMAGTAVQKVKLYDPGGLTVYSTDPSQIGGDYSQNARFLAALSGRPASLIEFRERFGAFAGPIEDRWILSSYVAVRAGEGQAIEGVAEIYRDVTAQYETIADETRTQLAVIAAVAVALFALLVGFVWKSERHLLVLHRREIELERSLGRIEAIARARSGFLAAISHHLRTPLNAILGFGRMIAEERIGPIQNPRYKEYAGDIVEAGEQLLSTVTDMLLLVRVDAGLIRPVFEPIELAPIAAAVVEAKRLAAERAGVTLALETGRETMRVDGDDSLVQQILMRLIDNAIKFTPTGGQIHVGLVVDGPARTCSLIVADTGIGIPPDKIELALAPFGQMDESVARGHEQGLGLGLSLAKLLADAVNATLNIESALGSGTRVTLCFSEAQSLPRRAAA